MAAATVNIAASTAATNAAKTAAQTATLSASPDPQQSFAQILQSRATTQNDTPALTSQTRQTQTSQSQSSESKNSQSESVPDQAASPSQTKTGASENPSRPNGASGKTEQNKNTKTATTTEGKQPAHPQRPIISVPLSELGAAIKTSKTTTDSKDTADTDADPLDISAVAAALAGQTASNAGSALPLDQRSTDAADDNATGSGKQSAVDLLAAEPSPKTSPLKTDLAADPALTDKPASTQDQTTSFANQLDTATQNLNAAQNLAPGSSQPAGNAQNVARYEVNTPVATQGWSDEVGQKITWAANENSGRAELILTPPHMGRVEVSISMNGDQASASFVAASSAARDALQDAMPRLREILAQAGIQLGQANVNTNTSGQTQSDSQSSRSGSSRYVGTDSSTLSGIDTLSGSTRSGWTRSGNGLVDTFA